MHVSLIESKSSQSFCSPNLKSCVKKAFQGLGIASIVSGGILSSSARVSDHSKKTLAPIFFILGSLVLIASKKINYFKQFSKYWACQFLDRMEGTDNFLAPNELNIDGLVEHIVPSQRNVLKILSSVGTERVFIHASLSEPDVVYSIDYNPNACKYNLINVVLIELSNSLGHYQILRMSLYPKELWEAEIKAYLKKHPEGLVSVYATQLLENLDEYIYFWTNQMQKKILDSINKLSPDKRIEDFSIFKNEFNYIHNERLFSRLKKIIKNGNFRIKVLNLKKQIDISSFFKQVNKENPRFTLSLDVSNCVSENFSSKDEKDNIQNAFLECCSKASTTSHLIFTKLTHPFRTNSPKKDFSWTYFKVPLDRSNLTDKIIQLVRKKNERFQTMDMRFCDLENKFTVNNFLVFQRRIDQNVFSFSLTNFEKVPTHYIELQQCQTNKSHYTYVMVLCGENIPQEFIDFVEKHWGEIYFPPNVTKSGLSTHLS